MKKTISLAMMSSCLWACSAPEPIQTEPELGTGPADCQGVYEVRTALGMDERYVSGVRFAAERWTRALFSTLTLHPSGTPGAQRYDACVVNVVVRDEAGTGNDAVTPTRRGANGKPEKAVLVVYGQAVGENIDNGPYLKSLFLHEFGHMIGLEHDEDRTHSSIMGPFATTSAELGCLDIQRACTIWGCDAGCTGDGWVDP